MTSASLYRLDDLLVDLPRQRVERGGATLDVAGLNFALLRYLIEQGERVVGFDELIANVWAPAVVNEETVTQRVKLLRSALGDDPRRPRYVRSVRGRGYQLCVAPMAVEASAQLTARSPRRLSFALGALALVGIALVALVFARRDATPTKSSASDDLVHRATYYAGIGQRDNNERAIVLFEQALAAAPEDRSARIGLSFAYSARVCLYDFSPDWADRAAALAASAVASAPNDAAAHAAAGYAHDCRGRIDAAIAEYERAFALDPTRTDSAASAANLYAVKGRIADALRVDLAVARDAGKLRFLDIQIARALELLGFTAAAEQRYLRSFTLNPDSIFSNDTYPRCLFLQGRFAQAQAALDVAMQRPHRPELIELQAELALLRGDRASAAESFAEAARLRPHQSVPSTLAALHAATPPTDAWIAATIATTERSIADGDTWPENWIEIALLELQRGDRAAALRALEAAVAAGFRDKAYLQTSALFRPLADEPAFAVIVDVIGRAVAKERETVLAAPWFPRDLMNGVTVTP